MLRHICNLMKWQLFTTPPLESHISGGILFTQLEKTMSTLFVDTINEKTTNNGIIIPGHVIQHKVHNLTTATNATGVNQTYTDLGGGSFSFTPKTIWK